MGKVIGKILQLKKTYRRLKRSPGFFGFFRDLVNPQYEYIEALKGVSFELREGEILGYIGPNGAGKTTTIKILSGILYPDSGEVEILGYCPWKQRKEYVKNIGVCFVGISPLWWYIPAEDTFLLHKEIYGLSKDEYKERIELFDELLGIKELLKIPPRKMSAGQRKRCEIALTFLHKPKVVFLDEPTVFLDVFAKEKIHDFIREIVRKEKVTVMLTTHILGDIEKLCDRILILNKGEIIFRGTLDDLKKYLQVKIIEIEIEEEISLKEIVKEYQVEKKGSKLVLKVPLEAVNPVLKDLFEKYNIKDLNVRYPSLEEVIKEICG